MARKYFTLVTRTGGQWAPQFGDFDREVVKDEERDTYSDRHSSNYVPSKDRKVIATSGKQADINAAIAALNS